MIILKVKGANENTLKGMATDMHDALKGWEPYVNSEVSLHHKYSDEDKFGEILLCIGEKGENDVRLNLTIDKPQYELKKEND